MRNRSTRRRGLLFSILVITYCICSIASAPAAEQTTLLDVTGGQLPNDTAFEDKTKLSFEYNATLGSPALKVQYAANDSFGMNGGPLANWKGFDGLHFTALNPRSTLVNLTFSVRHKNTTNFQTTVLHTIELKPGKSQVRIILDELVNANGSPPGPECCPTLVFFV